MGASEDRAVRGCVDDVIATQLLKERPGRPPNYASENDALLTLAQALARSPETIADHLVRQAMRLCQADSAGLSLVAEENGEPVFRWIATAGEFARYLGGTMPRHFSPCGEVLDRGTPMLMQSPERYYPDAAQLHAPIREGLLVPFESGGRLAGTIWVVCHTERRKFDSEDLRIVKSLAVFATAVSETVGLMQDLKATAERAQSENRRLAQWFDQAPGFIALLRGPHYVFEQVNRAYYELVGARDVIGRPLFEALPDTRNQGFEALLAGVYETGQPFVGRDMKIALRREAGRPPQEVYLDFVYQPLRAEDGTVEGIFVQGHDVTDRHRAIEALRMADRNKDEFIAKLSHELRNPLSPLKVAVEVLRRQGGAGDALQQRMLAAIDSQATAMTALVDDLLDISRIRTGKLVVRRSRLMLQDAVAAALAQARPNVEAREHQLALDLPEPPVWVDGDAQRLAQVICNLVNNAAKYTPPGGRIGVRLQAMRGEAVLQVRDNGIGIPPELLGRIFDLYQQAPEAQSASPGGLGIGLALVRQLAELHGGRVSAESDGAGCGSTFTLFLPALG